MNESSVKPPRAIRILRWAARIWSIVSIVFILLIAIGELIPPHAPPPSTLRDIVGMILFPFLTCVGMILAWRWEGLGGGITIGSVLAFYAWLGVMDGRLPRGPYFALVTGPGFLFLLLWVITAVGKKRGA